MSNKIGKVISYDTKNEYGYIFNNETKALFLNKDILEDTKIEVGNTVCYREETVQGVNRAYFVKKLKIK